MPIYEFIDKETKVVHQKIFSIKDKEEYLRDNPNLESYFSSPAALGDSARLGLKKPDEGFREVLSKIIERTPGSHRLNEKLSRSVPKKYIFE